MELVSKENRKKENNNICDILSYEMQGRYLTLGFTDVYD